MLGGWGEGDFGKVFDSRTGGAADRHGGDSGAARLHSLLQGSSTGVDVGKSAAEDLGKEAVKCEKEGLWRPK